MTLTGCHSLAEMSHRLIEDETSKIWSIVTINRITLEAGNTGDLMAEMKEDFGLMYNI